MNISMFFITWPKYWYFWELLSYFSIFTASDVQGIWSRFDCKRMSFMSFIGRETRGTGEGTRMGQEKERERGRRVTEKGTRERVGKRSRRQRMRWTN